MLLTDINAIGENAFYEFSLIETMEVIETLEKVVWSNTKDKNLQENSGFYSNLLDIVDDKITNNAFDTLSEDAEARNRLLLRILRVRTNISQYRLSFLLENVEEQINFQIKESTLHFEETKNKVESIANDTQNKIHEASIQTEKKINENIAEKEKTFDQKLEHKIESTTSKIEPHLITTVLTLMGVFSAIITIIMSVVITSSSWLNNAGGASAVIAFIVPNLVVISMAVLLNIVFYRKKSDIIIISDNNWDRDSFIEKALKKLRGSRIFIYALITVFIIFLISFSLYEIKNSEEPHVRYVLSQGMYKCEKIQNSSSEDSTLMIEFEINGKNYIVSYDEKYFHDGNLYFCEEHQMLE